MNLANPFALLDAANKKAATTDAGGNASKKKKNKSKKKSNAPSGERTFYATVLSLSPSPLRSCFP